MKFIRGGELFQHLYKKKKFSEELTKFYASQLLLAIEYLHSNGFVYRDLKPENILLKEKNNIKSIKLIDFGIAKVFKEK